MASLTDKRIKNTYDGLLKTTDNDPLGGSYKLITDGLGNSSNVYLGTGGAVGIGQSSPRGKFDVEGEVYVTTPNGIDALKISDVDIRIGDYDDANGFAFLHLDSQDFKFTTDSAEVMRITSAGNVGIGTTSPSTKLEVAGVTTISASTTNALYVNNSANSSAAIRSTNTYLSINANNYIILGSTTLNYHGIWALNNKPYRFQETDGTWVDILNLSGTDNVLKFGTITDVSTGGDIAFYADNSEKMRIDSSGNVGIGTTSPGEKLHVVGNIQINDHDGTGNLQIGASDGAGNDAIIGMAARNSSNGISPKVELRTIYDSSGGANGSAFTISTRSGSGLAEKMRIKSDGKLQINEYGSGTFTGTVARNLAVDSSGNIIENQANTRSVFVATSTDTTTNINATTTINWNSESIKDTGFTHSNTTNPNEITITQAGTYKVYASITYTTTVQRANIALEILVNDVSTGARGAGGYVRSSGGHNDGTTIVEDYVTVSANDVVKIQTSREANGGTVNLRSSESKIIIEKLTGLTLSTTDANTLNGFSSTDFVAVSGDAMTGGLTIDGDLGVGTTTPSHAVHVVGNGARIVSTATNANSGEIRLGLAGNNNIPYFEMGNSSTPNSFRISNAGYYQLGTTVDTDLRFNVNNNTAIHIESTNKFIGLNGVTSPLSMLSINNVNSQIGWQNNSTVRAFIGYKRSGNDTNLTFGTSITGDTEAEEKMRIDSNGNVGIGTTSPGAKLEVTGSNSVNALKITDFDGGDGLKITSHTTQGSYVQIYDASHTETIRFDARTDNANRHTYFNGGGNVGIGTTTPTSNLQVRGDNPVINISDSNSTSRYAALNFSTAGGTWNISSGDSTTGTSSNLFITRANDGTSNRFIFDRDLYYFGVYDNTNTQQVRLRASGNSFFNGGNVGIGTTSPQAKLQIQDGNLYFKNDSYGDDNRIGFGNPARNGDAAFIDYIGNGDFRGSLAFGVVTTAGVNTAATEIVRFDKSGNVGIGTTSPSKKFHVVTTGSVDVAKFETTGNAAILIERTASTQPGASKLTVANNGQLGISSDNLIKFLTSGHSGGTERMRINNDGKVGIGTTSPGATLHVESSSPEFRMSISGVGKVRFRMNGNNYINTGQNFGIGTTSPTHLLHVAGSANIEDDLTFGIGGFLGTSTTDFTMFSLGDLIYNADSNNNGNSNHIFKESGNELMRIDSSGNVGIGTTSPNAKLQVNDNVRIGDTSTGVRFYIQGVNEFRTDALDVSGNGWNSLHLRADGTNGLFLQKDTNNVGIGTTSPDRLLVLNHASDTRVKLQVNGTDTAQIQTLSNQARYHALGSSTSLQLWTNGAERMRITNGGSVGIGTTSPSAKLGVQGTIRIMSVGQKLQFANANVEVYRDTNNNLVLGGYGGINFNAESIAGGADAQARRMRIAADGGLFVYDLLGSSASNPEVRYNTTTGELYYNSSSIRYKEDVTDIESTIDKINKLRPVKFKVKESQQYTTGLIAEEVVEVIPEIVFEREIEGFDKPQIDGVAYNDLHAYYIKAIQEQQEMINELKTEIQTLKSQINS